MKLEILNGAIAGADPGFQVRRGRETASEVGGLGTALRPPVGPEQSPGGGPGGEAPGSSRVLEIS